MIKRNLLLLAVIILISGCGSESGVYTLYRNSIVDARMRIHLATFDAADGADYNSENCDLAAKLFRQQPRVETRFWCEKGPYKK